MARSKKEIKRKNKEIRKKSNNSDKNKDIRYSLAKKENLAFTQIKIETVILGAGASGLMIGALAGDRNTLIIEKKAKEGSKLLAAGNGRCNISNINIDTSKQVLEVFRKLGVYTKAIDTLIYPRSEDSKDILFALLEKVKENSCKILLNTPVENIEPLDKFIEVTDKDVEQVTHVDDKENLKGLEEHNFILRAKEKKIYCKNLVIATGGKSMPKLGTSGDGYVFARKLGHKIERLVPVLTSIEVCDEDIKELKGIRQKCFAKLLYEEKVVHREAGEVQFTDYGISGILVFNLSRHIKLSKKKSLVEGFRDYKIILDFAKDYSLEELETIFYKEIQEKLKRVEKIEITDLCVFLLNSWVKSSLGKIMAKRTLDTYCSAGENPKVVQNQNIEDSENDEDINESLKENLIIGSELSDEKIKVLSELLAMEMKDFEIGIVGTKGWEQAQVTRGGVSYDEVDRETLESKIVKNLFFAGEVLDYDGPCGGYNLNNAFFDGIKVSEALRKRKYENI